MKTRKSLAVLGLLVLPSCSSEDAPASGMGPGSSDAAAESADDSSAQDVSPDHAPPDSAPDAEPGADAPADTGDDQHDSAAPSERVWGVTVDSVDALPGIVDSLGSLSRKPTVRVVFDEFVEPDYYADPVAQMHGVAFVMGEILDSFYVAEVTVPEYEARTSSYVTALGSDVDIWEVGNEINGEWLGATPDVVAKMSAAYSVVKGAGGSTALTLYYNEECWESADHEMFAWAGANVPADMKAGLDYVLVSYYEDDCNGLQPDWPVVFHELATMFPNSKLGIGECGTTDDARKAEFVQRYYGMQIAEPSFVGGFFWWYFHQDMVPKTRPLWTTLNDAIAQGI